MIEGLIVGILEQGLIYGIMAMGVYITYTILDFPDLSVDGTFPLGIAICFVMINNGLNPWLALLAAFAAGCIAGMFTGIFNVKLRIRNLLCGILTMTALYSINYGIVGKASDFLSMDTTTIFSQTAFLFGNGRKRSRRATHAPASEQWWACGRQTRYRAPYRQGLKKSGMNNRTSRPGYRRRDGETAAASRYSGSRI